MKDFLISTKVRPKKEEHLHDEGVISSESTFNTLYEIIVCDWYEGGMPKTIASNHKKVNNYHILLKV